MAGGLGTTPRFLMMSSDSACGATQAGCGDARMRGCGAARGRAALQQPEHGKPRGSTADARRRTQQRTSGSPPSG